MDSIYLSFDGVGAAGWESFPKTGATSDLNDQALKCHYNNSKIFGDLDEVFLLEMTQAPGKAPLVLYQYLRYKGVKDRAGRTPSVFGVTVATDTFCPDSEMMLSLCRDIFHKCVVGGKLLAMSADGSITWLCNTLSDPQAVATHKDAEAKLVRILTAYQNSGMLTDMPVAGWAVTPALSLNNEAQLLVKMNPSDVNGPELASLLKSGKKVAVAGGFPPMSAQRAIDRANSAKLAAEKNAASLSSSLELSRNEVSRLSSEMSLLSKDLADSRRQYADRTSELETLKTQQKTMLSRYEAKGNYSCQQQLNDLKARLDALNPSHTGKQQSKGPGNPPPPQPRLKPWIPLAAAAAILLCALSFILGRYTSEDKLQPGRNDDDKSLVDETSNHETAKPDNEKLIFDDLGQDQPDKGPAGKAGRLTEPSVMPEEVPINKNGKNNDGGTSILPPGDENMGIQGASAGSSLDGHDGETPDFGSY